MLKGIILVDYTDQGRRAIKDSFKFSPNWALWLVEVNIFRNWI